MLTKPQRQMLRASIIHAAERYGGYFGTMRADELLADLDSARITDAELILRLKNHWLRLQPPGHTGARMFTAQDLIDIQGATAPRDKAPLCPRCRQEALPGKDWDVCFGCRAAKYSGLDKFGANKHCTRDALQIHHDEEFDDEQDY
jgi:hypothetical protein